MVNTAVNHFWEMRIKDGAKNYSSLRYLNIGSYKPGHRHNLIRNVVSEREIMRINTKLKMTTGTYILQVNRASFNQNIPDPTCILCKTEDEDMEHFLLRSSRVGSCQETYSVLCNNRL